MFALEIQFHDGVSPTETVFVRRPHAIIGSSEFAHVVIDGASRNLTELRLSRGIGREFSCQPVRKEGSQTALRPAFVEGNYTSEAELDLGGTVVRITSLDVDLLIKDKESADQAGVRILRQALMFRTPTFPAIAVLGPSPLFVSFQGSQSIQVGRSRSCGLRLDAADVSSEHARIGFDGHSFWVEDLGSTNGTFIGGAQGERVSGRRVLESNEVIRIGSEIQIKGVAAPEDISKVTWKSAEPVPPREEEIGEGTYPCVVATSEAVKPSRISLQQGSRILLGRDPSNDVWISAGHISRTHAEIHFTEQGEVELTDLSSNGTFVNGKRLPKETGVILQDHYTEIDLKSGVILAICFDEDEEARALASIERKPAPVSEVPRTGAGAAGFAPQTGHDWPQIGNAELPTPVSQQFTELFERPSVERAQEPVDDYGDADELESPSLFDSSVTSEENSSWPTPEPWNRERENSQFGGQDEDAFGAAQETPRSSSLRGWDEPLGARRADRRDNFSEEVKENPRDDWFQPGDGEESQFGSEGEEGWEEQEGWAQMEEDGMGSSAIRPFIPAVAVLVLLFAALLFSDFSSLFGK